MPDTAVPHPLTLLLSDRATVVAAADPRYASAREQFAVNANSPDHADHALAPDLIVCPADEADLGAALRFAAAHGYVLGLRSGGHHYAGLSSCERGAPPSMQLDMSAFAYVELDDAALANRDLSRPPAEPSHRVVLGAGAKLREVYRLMSRYSLIFPGGICEGVGIGGHLQSSSFGILAGTFGLGLDHVRSFRIAMADTGTIIECSSSEHPDLFWAVLGGSPGAFGVVVHYVLQLPNARMFPHAWGARLAWRYSHDRFQRQMDRLMRLFERRSFQAGRDFSVYAVVQPDIFDPYLADEVGPGAHHLNLLLVWTGVDHGSIHGVIPEALLDDDVAPGTTFHELFVGSFCQDTPPERMGVLSEEFEYAEDPDHHLAHILMALSAANPVGLLADRGRDRFDRIDFPEEERFEHARRARLRAEARGIDIATDRVRFAAASRFGSTTRPDFVSEWVEQNKALDAVEGAWAMLQFVVSGGQMTEPDDTNAFPQRAALVGFDNWVMWRQGAGEVVGRRARRWLAQCDAALSAQLEGPHAKMMYAPCGDLDISKPEVRRLFYPDDAHFERLCRVKGAYDPGERLRTRLTVPPLPGLARPAVHAAAPHRPIGPRIPAFRGDPTVFTRFLERAAETPEQPFLTWIAADGSFLPPLTFGALATQVGRQAAWLRHERGVAAGDRVVLCLAPGPGFVVSLLACMYAGAVPVPLTPFRPGADDREARVAQHVLADCQPVLVLCEAAAEGDGPVERVVPGASARHLDPHMASRHDAALVQYTSGTTGPPKGVELTFENLARQLDLTDTVLQMDEHTRGVGWVPLYHDLGLISILLGALTVGCELALMSPRTFMRRPALWFDAMHRFRATHTASPNFGFAVALAGTTPEQRAGWDLSRVQVLMSAAELIDAELMARFFEAFAITGLPRAAFCPAYGLAEHAVGVTLGGARTLAVDPAALARGRVVPTADGAVRLWSCGAVSDEVALRIVEDGRVLDDGAVGEIWVDSRSRAPRHVGWAPSGTGLGGRLAGSARDWLRTGDLGFVWEGELFPLGRMADRMRVDGEALYPDLLERAVNRRVSTIRPGSTVVYQDRRGRLGLAAEPRRGVSASRSALAAAIRVRASELGLALSEVHVLARGAVPRTTSGKVQRGALRTRLACSD